MSKIDDLAVKAAGNYASASGEVEAAFDPSWILLFAEIITEIFGMFESCGQDEEAAAKVCQNPSRVQKTLLRLRVRRSMGLRTSMRGVGQMVDAIEETGKTVTVEDVQLALQEVK
jgi:hypothetical protein